MSSAREPTAARKGPLLVHLRCLLKVHRNSKEKSKLQSPGGVTSRAWTRNTKEPVCLLLEFQIQVLLVVPCIIPTLFSALPESQGNDGGELHFPDSYSSRVLDMVTVLLERCTCMKVGRDVNAILSLTVLANLWLWSHIASMLP